MIYPDRSSAGKFLAHKLKKYLHRDNVLVLALPRGGVPVAFEVAEFLEATLDIFLVRKLGVPGDEELAMGAIATGCVRVLNEEVIECLKIPSSVIESVTIEEMDELQRREHAYRGDREGPEVTGKIVILVDDGLATGSTMRAAIRALRQEGPEKIVVAVPVSAVEACDEMALGADEIICGPTPTPFYGVGHWYDEFPQTTDDEVTALLHAAREIRKPDLVET
jgi:putative phosphoribosyl transferase